MQLPFAELAVVAERKIREYLLNPLHPAGGAKARYFLALGYELHDQERLQRDLLALAMRADMEERHTQFGVEYAGTTTLATPSGRAVQVRTVWILDGGAPPPRLITAYPAK